MPASGGLGIPRTAAFDAPAFERAVADLLRACGIEPDGVHTGRTPQRVRDHCEVALEMRQEGVCAARRENRRSE